MKRPLFLIAIFCAVFLTLEAQTKTWTGTGDGTNWGDANNWNPTAVPTALDDVVIPDGSTLTINVSATVKSIAVQGTSTLTISQSLTFTEASSFGINAVVNWSFGDLKGGGTLTNQGTMNLSTTLNKRIFDGITLNNEGSINIVDVGGSLRLIDAEVNNQSTGIIDLQADLSSISDLGSTNILNNSGTIKRTGTGSANIFVEVNNNGTITVESGNLTLTSFATLTGGVYNVASGSILALPASINCSGTLTGVLDGELNFRSLNILAPATAIFSFIGTGTANWPSGDLNGGGIFTNQATINLIGTQIKRILGATILNNEGTINTISTADLVIYDGVINNLATGIIDMQTDGSDIATFGSGSHILNNSGTIKRTGSTGSAIIAADLNNNGTITVESGTLDINNSATTLTNSAYNVAQGGILNWPNMVTCSGLLTGVIDGDLNWSGTLSVTDSAEFFFSGTQGVNWLSGELIGGGTLIIRNPSTINLTTTAVKDIRGDTTLNNEGTINITASGNLIITNGILNNEFSGIIDMQAVAGNIGHFGGNSHILNNSGTIKRTGAAGEQAVIFAQLNNNNGTISIESGRLDIIEPAILTAGFYNVASGGELNWSNFITCNSTMTGVIDGEFNWNSEINVPTTATFNFTGTQGINWTAGTLSGGGTLINQSTMNLINTTNKTISGGTTLSNEGIIIIPVAGDLNINDGTINNQPNGIIDLQADAGYIGFSGGTSHILNNAGVLKKTMGSGVTQVFPKVNNSGTIEVMSGVIEFLDLVNTVDGIVKGVATIDPPALVNFTNDGTFSPGVSTGPPGAFTGVLLIDGDFTSSPTSKLAIDLDGRMQGFEYDLLFIVGNAVMDGVVDVTMGFEGDVNDEFIVAKTLGTITQCTLATTTTSIFNGEQYNFDVACRNNNEVVLTIVDKTLGLDTFELAAEKIIVFPNPSRNSMTLRNDSEFALSSAKIIDISGRILKTIDLADMGHDKEISLQNYASGYYFVEIISDGRSLVKRIIKQ